jgi:hypothetical protein
MLWVTNVATAAGETSSGEEVTDSDDCTIHVITNPGYLKLVKYNDKDGDGKKARRERYLSGWEFAVTDPDGYSWLGCTSGRFGSVTILGLVPGEYTVTVYSPGWLDKY